MGPDGQASLPDGGSQPTTRCTRTQRTGRLLTSAPAITTGGTATRPHDVQFQQWRPGAEHAGVQLTTTTSPSSALGSTSVRPWSPRSWRRQDRQQNGITNLSSHISARSRCRGTASSSTSLGPGGGLFPPHRQPSGDKGSEAPGDPPSECTRKWRLTRELEGRPCL